MVARNIYGQQSRLQIGDCIEKEETLEAEWLLELLLLGGWGVGLCQMAEEVQGSGWRESATR